MQAQKSSRAEKRSQWRGGARRPDVVTSVLRAPFWHFTLLRLSAAFLVVSLLSGSALHFAERTLYGNFGIIESLHVALGWAALPIYLAYQASHVWTRWSTSQPHQRVTGVAAGVLGVLLIVSGVDLAMGWLLMPVALERNLHLWAALATCGVLALHAGPLALRRVAAAVR